MEGIIGIIKSIIFIIKLIIFIIKNTYFLTPTYVRKWSPFFSAHRLLKDSVPFEVQELHSKEIDQLNREMKYFRQSGWMIVGLALSIIFITTASLYPSFLHVMPEHTWAYIIGWLLLLGALLFPFHTAVLRKGDLQSNQKIIVLSTMVDEYHTSQYHEVKFDHLKGFFSLLDQQYTQYSVSTKDSELFEIHISMRSGKVLQMISAQTGEVIYRLFDEEKIPLEKNKKKVVWNVLKDLFRE